MPDPNQKIAAPLRNTSGGEVARADQIKAAPQLIASAAEFEAIPAFARIAGVRVVTAEDGREWTINASLDGLEPTVEETERKVADAATTAVLDARFQEPEGLPAGFSAMFGDGAGYMLLGWRADGRAYGPVGFEAPLEAVEDTFLRVVERSRDGSFLRGVHVGGAESGCHALDLDTESARRAAARAAVLPDAVPVGLLKEPFGATQNGDLTRALARDDGIASYLVRSDTKLVALEELRGPIKYIAHGGQSLANGGGAQGADPEDRTNLVMAPLPHRGLMFGGPGGGTRGTGEEEFDPATVNDFEPAAEVYSDNLGESQGTAMMQMLDARRIAEGEPRRLMVYRTHGKGGRTIAQLSKGTVPYANGVVQLQRAKEIAALYGYDLDASAWLWTQGETDRATGTTRAAYLAALQTLKADWQADVQSVLGSKVEPVLILDQLAAATNEDASDIALAQLDMVEAGLAYISTPKYWLNGDYGYVDSVHLTALGYDVLGEMQALAYRRILEEGNTSYRGLRPLSATLTGDTIDIVFDVLPGRILKFDTTLLTAATDRGFVYRDATSSASISSVAIVADDTVRITLDAMPSGANPTIEYAFVGGSNTTGRARAWGNLRDDGETAQSQVVPALVLHQWCVVFKKALA